jgi:hypothetical protein
LSIHHDDHHGECAICGAKLPIIDLIRHLTTEHDIEIDAAEMDFERWPDGEIVVHYDDFTPDDVLNPPDPR